MPWPRLQTAPGSLVLLCCSPHTAAGAPLSGCYRHEYSPWGTQAAVKVKAEVRETGDIEESERLINYTLNGTTFAITYHIKIIVIQNTIFVSVSRFKEINY